MAFEFLASFGELNKLLTQENYTALNNESFGSGPCTAAVNHQRFYLWLLVPGIVLSILLAFTQKRKALLIDCLDGRPGLLIPHNILSRSNRFSYVAVFGAITFLCSSIIIESRYAIDYNGPPYLKVFVALASMFIYGVGYFPLFASLAVDSIVGYGIGSLYAWMLGCITYYNTFYCPGISKMEYFMIFLRGLPELLCLLYLSFSLPFRFVRSLKRKNYCDSMDGQLKSKYLNNSIKYSYNGLHVRAIFRQHPPEPVESDSIKDKILNFITSLPGKIIYERLPGFRYSSRVLSVMGMGLILLYRLTVESLIFAIPAFQYFDIILQGAYAEIDKTRVGMITKDIGVYDGTMATINVVVYLLDVLNACILTALCLTFIIGAIMILHSLAQYRCNLLALYKGKNLHLTPREEKSCESLLVGSMRFAGYQVAYIAWGFVVQFLLLFVIFLLIAMLVILFKWNFGGWIMDKLHQVWPVLLTSVVVNLVQLVLAKVMFLQENEHGNVLAVDNRRSFFMLVYFMFFYNIFTGIISCLLRIGKAIILGALLLPRLDQSTLPRKFQAFDTGFDAYCGFMHVEATHTNPVAMVFIVVLQSEVLKRKRKRLQSETMLDTLGVDDEEKETLKKKASDCAVRAKLRWHLVYTLLNNPVILLQRKHNLLLSRKADIFRDTEMITPPESVDIRL